MPIEEDERGTAILSSRDICMMDHLPRLMESGVSCFIFNETVTTEIAAQMGNAMEGGEMKSALWTMALLLFAISLFFIFLIHHVTAVKPEKEEKTSTSVKTSTTAVPVKQFAAKGEN